MERDTELRWARFKDMTQCFSTGGRLLNLYRPANFVSRYVTYILPQLDNCFSLCAKHYCILLRSIFRSLVVWSEGWWGRQCL